MNKYCFLIGITLFQCIYAQTTPKYWSVRGNAGTSPDTHFLGTTDSQNLLFKTNNLEAIQLNLDGKIGLGVSNFSCTNCSGFRLFVKGFLKAEKIKLDIASENGWADYVFKSDYQLPGLEEVEQHIQKKGHLPNIPSAEEVVNNGIELGEMKAKLLAKIEELTLYTIELNKRNQNLTRQSSDLDHQINNQNEIIDKLQKRIENLELNHRKTF
ncbi:hypothetical protein ACL0VS_17730 [Chryseobacterium sp. PMSZPI]|uniref:hypothetical protein n=1 Tax=Chryseobacterium sp. PMSZPI TaxID=1033900 RepID=UPI0039A09C39